MKTSDLQLDIMGEQLDIAVIRLTRGAKRNALNDGLILSLRDCFENLPATVRAAVLTGEGEHFCAGLDLSELCERDAGEGLHHSRMWHAALERVQYGPVPVIAALHGAVVGGGLELASACHIRVADDTTFYALPEGSRGIFVGGGGAVRIPRLIGAARMTDMMLTGRVYNAAEGERVGLAQYLVPTGTAFEKALEIAQRADARPAAHSRAARRSWLLHGIHDGRDCPKRAASQGARARLSRRPCGQGQKVLKPSLIFFALTVCSPCIRRIRHEQPPRRQRPIS
jgi:(methylthio)acryloyl-CoA hydratase